MAAVALVCTVLLLVRFVAFPRIEAHHDDIAQRLAARIGQPVSIAAIVTGWDGWSPRLSIRGFMVGDAAHPVLDLPRVDLVIGWSSLVALDFRLKELALESPRLAIRRDAEGRFHVAGIEVDPDAMPDDRGVTDWLLRQREIVIHDGLVTWNDELRHAPQLILDRVQLRLEQDSGHHRFGLTGIPPTELSAPIDVRGDFDGDSLRSWQKAHGRAYVRLDYADVAAWGNWLPLPFSVQSGKGALRLWFDFAQGQARELTADLELADVRATLGAGLTPLDLVHVAGRIAGKRDGGHSELYTSGLEFAARNGTRLDATDLILTHDEANGDRHAHGSIAFERLDLAALSTLAEHLPLPQRLREDLVRFVPRGLLNQGKAAWVGNPDAPESYQASATLQAVGFAANGSFPGATGLSGSVEATQDKGTFKLDAHGLTFALPQVLPETVALESASGAVHWQREGENLSVRVDALQLASAQVSAKASGTWHSLPSGPGHIDMTAEVPRFDAAQVPRFLPVTLHATLRDWLRRVVVKGQASDARLTLRGDLARFPFTQARDEHFQFGFKARGVTLDYAQGWPAVSDVDGELRFEGRTLSIDATGGRVLGATIGKTHAEIADLGDMHRTLLIDGEASGPTNDFLSFVAQSPIGGWVDHATDDVQATGNGKLALKFALPLSALEQVSVSGEYQFADNKVRAPGLPPIAALTGALSFTEKELHARDVAAEALGGPLRIQLNAAPGALRVIGAGTLNAALLRNEFDVPLLDRLAGNADWTLDLQTRAGTSTWTVESPLRGVTIDLPAPLGKRADETVALRIDRREPRANEDQLAIDLGKNVRALLHRRITPTSARADRALVLLGRAVDRDSLAQRTGLWVRGDVPTLDADAWLAFYRGLDARPDASGGGPTLALEGLDIHAVSLLALGRAFNDLQVSGRHLAEDWRLTLKGREIDGNANWRAPSPAQPNGRIVARLARLSVPPSSDAVQATADPNRPASSAQAWPEIDLVAETFESKGRALGKLEFTAAPAGTDWQIDRLALINDAGRIDAHGLWRAGGAQQTKLDVALDVKEAGAFLARFNMPDAVKGAATRIEGQLTWAGAPSDFDYPSLNGAFEVNTAAGQFIKLDPGVGRLLGVLSLQALPRRVTLDFRDVFSEGFAFDSLTGNVRIKNGLMHTDNLHMVGPAAAVDISGDADLAHESQQLRVRLQPSLTTSVSAGAAVLFIANPLVGAAVGAGALLAQKMLNNPIEQLFSYEYAITGAWDDPVVQRVPRRATASSTETFTR